MSLVDNLADAVPIENKAELLITSAVYGAFACPGVGVISLGLTPSLTQLGVPSAVTLGATVLLTCSTMPFLLAKASKVFPIGKGNRGSPVVVKLGTMTFTETDLFTNLLITGTIGSGKTSSVIYPVLRQLCMYYNEEGDGPRQKWGGLVLDVKGEFYETLIYFLYLSGRDVLRDLVIIRPDADYPMVKFLDVDNGNYFWITAAGGAEAREIDLLTNGYTLPDGSPISSNLFTGDEDFREPHEEALRNIIFEVKQELKFLGWRYSNGTLVRVQKTNPDRSEVYRKSESNAEIRVPIPKRLQYIGVEHVNNGLKYNICSPHLPAAEVASRLIAIAETLGGGMGSENSYWTDSAKKHIGYIINLWRKVKKDVQCSAVDIVRLTTQKSALTEVMNLHKQKLDEIQNAIIHANDDQKRRDKETERKYLEDIGKYFTEEWDKLDAKTKGIIVSVISNLFGPFLTDPKLQEVFCKPATFSFEDCIQKGTVFTLLTGGNYETLAKQLGTSMKMDFQSVAKARTAQAHLNKTRVLVFMCDEAQNFVTAGGGNNTGDENFMSLSRQSRVINVIATQSDSSIISVIGEKKAPVYFQSFGSRVWLQNSDYTTNLNATRVIGKAKKEKITSSGREMSIEGIFSKEAVAQTANSSYEEEERFKLEDFSNLNTFDAIVFNKGKKGARKKTTKYKGVPDPVGSEKKHERFMVLRWYYQAYIENRLDAIGESHRLDPDHISIDGGASMQKFKESKGRSSGAQAGSSANIPEPVKPAPEVVNFQSAQEPPPPAKPPTQPRPATSTTKASIQPKPEEDLDLVDEDDDLFGAATVPPGSTKGGVGVSDPSAFANPLGDYNEKASIKSKADFGGPDKSDDDDDLDEEEVAAAEELLEEAKGPAVLSPAQIEDIHQRYGSPEQIKARLLSFVSVIEEGTPMEEDADPHTILIQAQDAGSVESGTVGSGIYIPGRHKEQAEPVQPVVPEVDPADTVPTSTISTRLAKKKFSVLDD
jgi:hypothetical protein